MNFTLVTVLTVIALFLAMLGVQEWGKWLGGRHRLLDAESTKQGYGATEGAVFVLLGLFLAFTFSDAGERFGAGRHLILEEANAIEACGFAAIFFRSTGSPKCEHSCVNTWPHVSRLDRCHAGPAASTSDGSARALALRISHAHAPRCSRTECRAPAGSSAHANSPSRLLARFCQNFLSSRR
jgi:hypothetical protein